MGEVPPVRHPIKQLPQNLQNNTDVGDSRDYRNPPGRPHIVLCSLSNRVPSILMEAGHKNVLNSGQCPKVSSARRHQAQAWL